ncbi:vesicle transport protein SFT2A isoform X1 [Corvus cornix cornix]|uniref:vesicle transport protein SFT2A isoform X1 n=1 Tax=Corvus moneduloides TaxID=1196302 RepID=UPI001362FA57|nr:vesicle transport protein SFT2A isoform X1 [Corvus moneduloides]XP_031958339.1 vesicle transport protein SFT2A isoform X1 [Corvus moneduloides]XP_039424621.1 vesicle transport protein SFT2A isoform X1 [Corvus cornix cornix]XP_039424622.1 vesicle transport protein SFT2A isoform X1 [Corvus cornix cornix]
MPTPRWGRVFPGRAKGGKGDGLAREKIGGCRRGASSHSAPAAGAARPPLAMGLQPRRAAGPCPPAGRSAALPGARSAPPWARSDEPEGTPGRPATLPPLLPAILPAASSSPAAARAQPKKPPATASAPKKAAPRPAEEKGARKARGAPPERPGPLSSSWPCSSLQRPPPRRPPAERAARPQPTPPQPRGRPGAPGAGSRSCESLGGAPGEAAGRFSLSLPPEAIRVLQRRSLERQRGQPAPSPAGRAAPARRGDLRALLKVSLLNDRHRYDDEEYEEEEAGAAADEGLVRKCTEWLRGVESAAGRDHPERLETLPHLGTL